MTLLADFIAPDRPTIGPPQLRGIKLGMVLDQPGRGSSHWPSTTAALASTLISPPVPAVSASSRYPWIALSPDAGVFTKSHSYGTLRMWDTRAGRIVANLPA
jgi:hypothetical protein